MSTISFTLPKYKDYRKFKNCTVCGILIRGTKKYCKPCSYEIILETRKRYRKKILKEVRLLKRSQTS